MSNGYIVDAKLGAFFRPRHVDAQGQLIEQGDWDSNMILDVAIDYMKDGFPAEPTPIVGSSIIDVTVDQEGVQAPITGMTVTKTKTVQAAKLTRVNDYSAYVSWITEYTYKNTSAATANISEIGINNFNRAVFKDDQGVARSWSVSPNENLIVEMEMRISFTSPNVATNITSVDQDGATVDTFTCKTTVANQISAGTPQWWKLLAKPAHNVYLVTDAAFAGLDKPADASKLVAANVASDFTYTGRSIAIDIRHRAGIGGLDVKGLLVEFACLSPAYGFVFSKNVRIGSGYSYSAGLNITW